MPSAARSLSAADVRDLVAEACAPAERGVGVELEWLTHDARPVWPDGAGPSGPQPDVGRPPLARLRAAIAAAGALPAGGLASIEPGGQVEVSTAPAATIDTACEAAARDAGVLRSSLAAEDVTATALGADPHRPDRRLVRSPRYDAMEAWFDQAGPDGRRMMCSTAAIQVNVGPGTGDATTAERQWEIAHATAPLVAAACASSPLRLGRPTGWRSARLASWAAIDPARTAATRTPSDGRPIAIAWADQALAARVLLVGDRPEGGRSAAPPMSLGDWVEHGHDGGWPTAADVRAHLTTLFPPVRPKGWLEVRLPDALPDPWWRAAVALVAVPLLDDEAGERSLEATAGLAATWVDAARHGLDDPALACAASRWASAVLDGLARLGAGHEVTAATERFVERFTLRSRCPADDVLATWRAEPCATTAQLAASLAPDEVTRCAPSPPARSDTSGLPAPVGR